MIAVIADDLTGAAELGGVGLSNNLQVEIATEVDKNTKAELLIVSADTRSISEQDAVAKIKRLTLELLALRPEMIFKKINSVLRGHVVAELKAQMEVMQRSVALVIPANPFLSRTIKEGHYFFKGEPIHKSSFSQDPEFPIQSSSVVEMLRAKGDDVIVLNHKQALPPSGIVVGEVADNIDLQSWATMIDDRFLLAGASGFFTAVLNKMQAHGETLNVEPENELKTPMLFVCGTTFSKSRIAIREVAEKGGPVSYMPREIVLSNGNISDAVKDWSSDVVKLLSANGKAIIAIEETAKSTNSNASELRERTACVVNKVTQKTQVRELVVEGGSTAASIIRKLNFKRLIPVKELSPGVIRMRVEANDKLFLTIKPGSYNWSDELWKF